MNVLDENILESQRQLLRAWRIPVRQISYDVGRKGMADEDVIPFLRRLRRPTLFSRDLGLYEPRALPSALLPCLSGGRSI